MSEYGYDGGGHCPECDGTGDSHYPGCTYDGTYRRRVELWMKCISQ